LLSERIPVRWESRQPATANQGGIVRLELHLIPLSTTPGLTTPTFPYAQGALVSAGRHSGVFPVSATVSIQATNDYVAAVLTDTRGSVTSGLRINSGGERSAWLTLPPTPQGDVPAAIRFQLAKLLPALAGLRPALPERVTLAAAISTPSGQVLLDPRNSLPSGYLTSHTPQVADELAGQLNTAASADR
jgi:hypothetical protein